MKTTNLLFQITQISFKRPCSILCFVVLFLMGSCSPNEPLLETITQANLVSAKGIENTPGESGVFVLRYSVEGILAYTLVDPKSQLVLTTGYPDQSPSYCGGGYSTDIINVQDIIAGSNDFRHIIFAQGEVRAKVFKGSFVWNNNVAEFCSFIANAPLLAEGTATIVYHDNDPYGSYNHNHTNMFGFSVQGQLITPDGELKRLSAGSNFLWPVDVEDVNSILDVLMNVTVRLN